LIEFFVVSTIDVEQKTQSESVSSTIDKLEELKRKREVFSFKSLNIFLKIIFYY